MQGLRTCLEPCEDNGKWQQMEEPHVPLLSQSHWLSGRKTTTDGSHGLAPSKNSLRDEGYSAMGLCALRTSLCAQDRTRRRVLCHSAFPELLNMEGKHSLFTDFSLFFLERL